MPVKIPRLMLCAALVPVLAACSLTGKESAMFLIDPPTQADTLPNRLGRIEVREVTLPQYATGQEIVRQGADGALRSDPATLWADEPARGLARALARQISEASGATAVAAPWPLTTPPDRRLEVRVDRIFAGRDGRFYLTGQYFVAPLTEEGRDIVRRFDLVEPIAGPDAAGVAAAQSRAVQTLARQIAQLK
jgi:uncharacterized lipoprotein YmbA